MTVRDSYPIEGKLRLLPIRAGKITNLPATHLLPVYSVKKTNLRTFKCF